MVKRYGEKAAREAEEVFWRMSIVEDVFTAIEAGVKGKTGDPNVYSTFSGSAVSSFSG